MNRTVLFVVWALISVGLVLPGSMQASAASAGDRARISALEQQVQALLDREAIRQVIADYGRTIDARDWSAHRELYSDPLEIDYSSMQGPPAAKMSPDAWTQQMQAFFAQLPASQHVTGTLKLDVRGNEAQAVALLHAQHYLPNPMGEPVQRMMGTYDIWLLRTPGGWRIHKIMPHVGWNEGNFWIFQKAAGQLPGQ